MLVCVGCRPPLSVWRMSGRGDERDLPRRNHHAAIAVILLIAWLLGLVGTFTIGPILHVLLVVALMLFVVGLLSGRRSLA
jgi:Family of unknown function (DUF5670)